MQNTVTPVAAAGSSAEASTVLHTSSGTAAGADNCGRTADRELGPGTTLELVCGLVTERAPAPEGESASSWAALLGAGS